MMILFDDNDNLIHLDLIDCVGKWIMRTRGCYTLHNKINNDFTSTPILLLQIDQRNNKFYYFSDFCFGKVDSSCQLDLYNDHAWVEANQPEKYDEPEIIFEILGNRTELQLFREGIKRFGDDNIYLQTGEGFYIRKHNINKEFDLLKFLNLIISISKEKFFKTI